MEQEMWLARDWDDSLWLIIGVEPIKLQFIWGYPPDATSVELDSRLYPDVQWSDDKPTKVKLVIEK